MIFGIYITFHKSIRLSVATVRLITNSMLTITTVKSTFVLTFNIVFKRLPFFQEHNSPHTVRATVRRFFLKSKLTLFIHLKKSAFSKFNNQTRPETQQNGMYNYQNKHFQLE